MEKGPISVILFKSLFFQNTRRGKIRKLISPKP